VTRAISGHATEQMQRRYSTVDSASISRDPVPSARSLVGRA
jgi:hypothetical protein